MIKPIEKTIPKPTKPMLLFVTRCCETCMLAYRWIKVPTKEGWPMCPKCGNSLYFLSTCRVKIKK